VVEALLSSVAKIDVSTAPVADSVLIAQNLALLAVAIVAFRQPHRVKAAPRSAAV
jgi:hypothetical protein